MLLPQAEGERRCDVFLAPLVPDALDPALLLQRDLRRAGVRVLLDNEGRGLKSQMKKADKLGARFVAIRGEDERARDVWMVRDMAGSSQEEVRAAGRSGTSRRRSRGERWGPTRTQLCGSLARSTWDGRSRHGWAPPPRLGGVISSTARTREGIWQGRGRPRWRRRPTHRRGTASAAETVHAGGGGGQASPRPNPKRPRARSR